LRYAECLSAFVYEPGDPVAGEVSVIMYGGIAYTLTFPVQEKIYFYILHGSDTLATNIPDVVVPDTNVVTWSFGEGESLELFIDSTVNWPPGEYELYFYLTASPEFELVLEFEVDAPVPVELMAFTAELVDQSGQQDVLLEWTTATEINNYGWHIERYDQAGWERIGWQDGNGNSNSPKTYSYLDQTAQGLGVQYRLLQIDNDGTS
jgi:hypothetical protein